MLKDATTVHISIVTAICSFAVAAISIVLGFLLIHYGTTGAVELQIQTPTVKVNFYSYVPGVVFGIFGAFIACKALNTLIRK